MSKKSIKSVALILIISFVTSCMTTMTGIAPSSTPITAEDTYTVIGPTVGRAWGLMTFIPIFENDPSLKARDRAIQKAGADALIEVTEDYTMIYLYYIQIYITRVRGTAVKVQRGGAVK